MNQPTLKLAILDLYDNEPNQGMRAIREIVEKYKNETSYQIFDVRGKGELPDTSFDIYISSGGPGNPLDGDGVWDKKYFDFIDELWHINQSNLGPKKHVFFICHSFQMVCNHFGLATVNKRKSRSFGTFPVDMTVAGKSDQFLTGLKNQFWVADFRDYQVVKPNKAVIEAMGAEILCIEKERPHVDLERAIMAMRFSAEFFGTQFHPEADPKGMIVHFSKEKNQKFIIENFGEEKYQQMIQDLRDEDKIPSTYNTILPSFLNNAIKMLKRALVVV